MAGTGTAKTRLVVLRGNSGSGKSATARALTARVGHGIAWVEQDYLRRVVLREHADHSTNVGLVSLTTRYALDHGYHVVLEGMLDAQRYSNMLAMLQQDHAGETLYYYFDVSFEETVRRHATRPQADHFGSEEMSSWYRDRDLLSFTEELLVPERSSLDQTVDRIMHEAQLFPAQALPAGLDSV